MLRNSRDRYLFVDVLCEILLRIDGIGIALSLQRVTIIALYHAAGYALCRSTACSTPLRILRRLLILRGALRVVLLIVRNVEKLVTEHTLCRNHQQHH